jgi:hypothetical protein
MPMPVLVLIGFLCGFGASFGANYLLFHLLHLGNAALPIAAVCGAIGAAYSALAFSWGVYEVGFLSILGYILDVTWSLLNTLAGFIVWLPVCAISGSNFVGPDESTQRSGTFVYDQNPRGGGYQATTIGNVIAGGWSTHEEIHVWQARLFGPMYLPVYVINLVLNLIFRSISGNFDNYGEQAYRRISFEDWAYAAGHVGGGDIDWGWWILWLLLTSIYVALVVMVIAGIVAKVVVISIVGAAGLLVYSIIRVFAPPASSD